MRGTHVVVECLQVREGLDELKVVRRRRLAEQSKSLHTRIVSAFVHERVEQRCDLANELGIAIHVRDYKYLTVLRGLTTSRQSAREQIAQPFIERGLQNIRQLEQNGLGCRRALKIQERLRRGPDLEDSEQIRTVDLLQHIEVHDAGTGLGIRGQFFQHLSPALRI